MSYTDRKITQAEINAHHVQGATDYLIGNAQQNKAVFDDLPEFIAGKFNDLIDEIAGQHGDEIKVAVDEWLAEHPEVTTTVQDNSLTTAKYVDGSVTEPKIAEGAVTPTKLDRTYSTPADLASVNANLTNELNVLDGRMDEFASLPEGSTTADAELLDIRVGTDGKTYQTAGGAVRGQVGELKSDLTALNDIDVKVFSEEANLSASEFGAYYITSSGVMNASSSWRTYLINVADQALIRVISHYSTLPQYIAVAFYDSVTPSDSAYISGVQFSDADAVTGTETTFNSIHIPENAKSILICNYVSNGDPKIFTIQNGIYNSMKELHSDLIDQSILFDIVPYSVEGANYINSSGIINASSSWESFLFQANAFNIKEYIGYTNNLGYYAISYYSTSTPTDASFIGGIRFVDGEEVDGKRKFNSVDIPDEAVSVLVCNRKASGTDITLNGYRINVLEDLYYDVSQITNLKHPYYGDKISIARKYDYEKLFSSVGQDGAQYNGVLFRFSANNTFSVIQLPDGNVLGSGSMNGTDVPHCNSVFFSNEFYSENDDYPIIYVNGYNGTDGNGNRLAYGQLYAYRIIVNNGNYSAELLQKIDCSALDLGGYGNFAFNPEDNEVVLIDYHNTGQNFYYCFARPDLNESVKQISAADITESFNDTNGTPSMQGCTLDNGNIYITYGGINNGQLAVISLEKQKRVSYLSLVEGGLTFEPEYADIYEGYLLIGGSIVYKMLFN